MLNRRHSSKLGMRGRQGAVAVEFAITAGLVFLLSFASLEFCRVAMIRHTVENALYEAGRAGIVPGATRNSVEAKARSILSTIAVRNARVQVVPDVITDTSPSIQVTIEVPLDENVLGIAKFFKGKTVSRSFTMQRERA